MTPYETNPLLAHLSITALVVIAHIACGVVLVRKNHDRRRHFAWFIIWHGAIISLLANLCLIFPDPPGRQIVVGVAVILLVALFRWGFRRKESESPEP